PSEGHHQPRDVAEGAHLTAPVAQFAGEREPSFLLLARLGELAQHLEQVAEVADGDAFLAAVAGLARERVGTLVALARLRVPALRVEVVAEVADRLRL